MEDEKLNIRWIDNMSIITNGMQHCVLPWDHPDYQAQLSRILQRVFLQGKWARAKELTKLLDSRY